MMYLQMVKIEDEKKEIVNSAQSFDELSFSVKYENTSFFKRIFKLGTGLSPAAYRKKFFQYVEV